MGDSTASPTAALLLTIVQDSAGRIATIIFAHRLGTSLEPECKMWRLAADVFNDAAMIIDCLSPAFPRTPRILLLSASSTLRALCGVAAGSAKASLSAHFAKWGNLGELNAKDSSQETVISLIGMLAGSVVVRYITTPATTWMCLLTLLFFHLAMNYAAVRAVSMRTLNRQRANIVFSKLLTDGVALTPEQVAEHETIFERSGVLRWNRGPVMAHVRVGVPLYTLTNALKSQEAHPSSKASMQCLKLTELLTLFEKEPFVLWYSPYQKVVTIVLKSDAGHSQLKAWMHALHMVRKWQASSKPGTQSLASVLQSSLQDLNQHWDQHLQSLEEAGWDTESPNIETISGTRLAVIDPDTKQ